MATKEVNKKSKRNTKITLLKDKKEYFVGSELAKILVKQKRATIVK